MHFSSGFFLVLSLFITWELYRYVNKTNRQITQFLNAIEFNDHAIQYQNKKGSIIYKRLNESLNRIIQSFKELKVAKESQHIYLHTVIDQIDVPILCFDNELRIKLFNKAAQQLFDKPFMYQLNSLDIICPDLFQKLVSIKNGETGLIPCRINKSQKRLLVNCVEFSLEEAGLKLITLKNIHAELNSQEAESWQKLIRVLTHEIMNSMTPLISLSSTLISNIEDENGHPKTLNDFDQEDLADLHHGLFTIERRSTGLLHFVQNYRSLINIPALKLQEEDLKDILEQQVHFWQAEFNKEGVSFDLKLEQPLSSINIDRALLIQVLINLIKNALESLKEQKNKLLSIRCFQNKENVFIQVIDNGPGIEDELKDKIFIPFFTSKEKGSGIGLSLSQQIVQKHGGELSLISTQSGETIFQMELPV